MGKKKIEKVSDCIASCWEARGRICRGKGKDVACQINYKPSWNLHIKVILVCIIEGLFMIDLDLIFEYYRVFLAKVVTKTTVL